MKTSIIRLCGGCAWSRLSAYLCQLAEVLQGLQCHGLSDLCMRRCCSLLGGRRRRAVQRSRTAYGGAVDSPLLHGNTGLSGVLQTVGGAHWDRRLQRRGAGAVRPLPPAYAGQCRSNLLGQGQACGASEDCQQAGLRLVQVLRRCGCSHAAEDDGPSQTPHHSVSVRAQGQAAKNKQSLAGRSLASCRRDRQPGTKFGRQECGFLPKCLQKHPIIRQQGPLSEV